MSLFSRLFGNRGDRPVADLDTRLERLEAEADSASPGYVGTSYNRAGDLALKEGHGARAVAYYGRAIDAFLDDGQREAARGVANKIIRVRPSAVRTLCTLTWLDLAARHSATALLHLRDYVQAARELDRGTLAAHQIYEMARLVPESEFVGAVADALDMLDYSERADEVRGWASADGSPDAISDPSALSQACLEAAVSNEGGMPAAKATEAEAEGEGDAEGQDPAVADEHGEEGAPAAAAPKKSGKRKYRWD